MRILAQSVERVVGAFLHPGYISASSREMFPENFPLGTPLIGEKPRIRLDLVQALRLEGDLPGAAASTLGQEAGVLALAALALFASLAAIYVLGRRGMGPRWAVAGVAASFLALACLAGWGGGLDPPDARASAASFADPKKATIAILNGIVADAITSADLEKLSSLDDVENEVGLPTAEPTAGMKHAIANYGSDGWGNPFKLGGSKSKGYLVRSSGADGKHKTKDDMSIRVRLSRGKTWDENRSAFFIRMVDGEHLVLFHAFSGDLFEYTNQGLAKEVTGTDRYDLFTEKDLLKQQRWKVQAVYKKASGGGGHEPLVMLVW